MDAETVVIEFDTRCTASLRETWHATVPAGLSDDDELREHLFEELQAGRCTLVEEESDDEHDRTITNILGKVEDEPTESTGSAAAAIAAFTEVWALGAMDIAASGAMQCAEATALAALFIFGGQPETAREIMERHAASDEPGDEHYNAPDTTNAAQ